MAEKFDRDSLEKFRQAGMRWNSQRILDLLIRNSLVIVLLMAMVYFAIQERALREYRQPASSPHRCGPLRPDRPRSNACHPDRRNRPLCGEPHCTWRDGFRLDCDQEPGDDLARTSWRNCGGNTRGVINGVVVAYLDVPPFVATLGMLTAASGFAYFIGVGRPSTAYPIHLV